MMRRPPPVRPPKQALTDVEIGRLVREMRANPAFFASVALKIADKSKAIIPLKYTRLQERAAEIVVQLDKLGVPARIINLKARQVMMSTLWMSIAFWKHVFDPGPRVSAVMGDQYDTTDSLKGMAELFHQNLPYYLQRAVKSEVSLEYQDTGAYFKWQTANRPGRRVLQGFTGSTVIGTEVPYYRAADDIFLSVQNTMPRLAGTLAVKEGTAAGAQGHFYNEWLKAVDNVHNLCIRFGARDLHDLLFNDTGWGDLPDADGVRHPDGFWDGSYVPLFFAWWENPEYRADPVTESVTEDSLNEEERGFRDLYGCDLEQIAWIRWCERVNCSGDPNKRRQEYPSNWREAFLYSGKMVCNPVIVNEWAEKTHTESKISTVELEWSADRHPLHIPCFDEAGNCTNMHSLKVDAWKPEPHDKRRITSIFGLIHDTFRLFRMPRRTHYDRYVIGADVAEGLDQGDYSVAYVLDRIAWEVVMGYRGHIDEKQFSEVLALMGTFYHNAWILCESNDMGRVTIDNLQRIYPSILNGFRVEKGVVEQHQRLGQKMTEQSKTILVSEVKTFVTDSPWAMPFNQFWVEAASFTQDARGRYGAEGKRLDPNSPNFDDSFVAMGHTLLAHRLAPLPMARPGRRTDVDDQEDRDDGPLQLVEEGYLHA